MQVSEFLSKWEKTIERRNSYLAVGDYSKEQAIYERDSACESFDLSRHQVSAIARGAASLIVYENRYGKALRYVSNLLPQTSLVRRGATLEQCLTTADRIMNERLGSCWTLIPLDILPR
jgi:hypothetical protein